MQQAFICTINVHAINASCSPHETCMLQIDGRKQLPLHDQKQHLENLILSLPYIFYPSVTVRKIHNFLHMLF